jgi:hypothetical protein
MGSALPIPLRYWTAASKDLTAQVHTIIRTTIAQYYVNQAVRRGVSGKRSNRDQFRLFNVLEVPSSSTFTSI